jgi:hypothetical protein
MQAHAAVVPLQQSMTTTAKRHIEAVLNFVFCSSNVFQRIQYAHTVRKIKAWNEVQAWSAPGSL